MLPNYNHAHFLPTCLDRYLSQTRPPDEILVIDDGSTDESLQILEQYSRLHPRLRVLVNERNQGVVFSFHRALRESCCEYIYCGAADDFPEPGLLEALIALAERYPQANIVSTNYFLAIDRPDEQSRGSSRISLLDKPGFLTPPQLAERLRSARNPSVGLVMHRREAVLAHGVIEAAWYFDLVHNLIASLRSGLAHTPQELVAFRVSPSTYSGQGTRQAARDLAAMGALMRTLLRPEFADVLPLVKRSRILSLYGWRALQVAWTEPDCRTLLPHLLNAKTFYVAWRTWMSHRLGPLLPSWLRRRLRSVG